MLVQAPVSEIRGHVDVPVAPSMEPFQLRRITFRLERHLNAFKPLSFSSDNVSLRST